MNIKRRKWHPRPMDDADDDINESVDLTEVQEQEEVRENGEGKNSAIATNDTVHEGTYEATPSEGFTVDAQGLWYQDLGKPSSPRIWVCSPLYVTKPVTDIASRNHGRVVEFTDDQGVFHREVISLEELHTRPSKVKGQLVSLGLKLDHSREAMKLLIRYIDFTPVTGALVHVQQTGWQDTVFVLPDQNYGESERQFLLNSPFDYSKLYGCQGSLAQWQKEVARFAIGNSRLVLCHQHGFCRSLTKAARRRKRGNQFS